MLKDFRKKAIGIRFMKTTKYIGEDMKKINVFQSESNKEIALKYMEK